MDPSLTYNVFGHTYVSVKIRVLSLLYQTIFITTQDDEDLKKNKIRRATNEIRLRKRKKARRKSKSSHSRQKELKFPSLVQKQIEEMKTRVITPEVRDFL